QKLHETVKNSAADASLDEIKIEPEEYSKYLALAYKQETFPKPRNIIGLAKDLPDAEMEQLILTHIEVSDDDLGELAKQRAKAVEDYLLQTGQLGSERIYLVTPKALSPDKKDGAKDSRVDFALQSWSVCSIEELPGARAEKSCQTCLRCLSSSGRQRSLPVQRPVLDHFR